jgi:polyamine oxidase
LKHTYPRNEFVDHGEDPYFVADPRGFEIVVQYLAKQFLSSLKSDPRLKLNKVTF